ncbi:hypothetical protein NK718_02545 [Alsobacter sp. SYSU M60028]|uniref:Uncharacterized protein n=1 Tax=Alsobacter ponti TaxID=2962936 RepID=A0ABT1L7D0_9HYPH|nr:hypothetical protein [Alsobacter ponti]MCP8937382.1 hypothetical protein [Alsobacter ponti]
MAKVAPAQTNIPLTRSTFALPKSKAAEGASFDVVLAGALRAWRQWSPADRIAIGAAAALSIIAIVVWALALPNLLA